MAGSELKNARLGPAMHILNMRLSHSLLGAVSGAYQWFKRCHEGSTSGSNYLFLLPSDLPHYYYTAHRMRFTTIGFLTSGAFMASTVIAITSNCIKGSYYCGSRLLQIGLLTWYHGRASILSLINYHWHQEITKAESSKPWVIQLSLKTLTTSIIHVFTASIMAASATSSSMNSVQRVVRMETVNRKSVNPAL